MQASPFEALFARLAQSDFRSRFRLGPEEVACIERRGMAVIRRHAEDFVRRRLAPAFIPNDGRQTPMRGHPVFIAQHATACCCRGCLAKWHAIPAGLELTAREFELLHTFAAAPGRVFTREMLLAKLWGYDFYGDERVVDSHIKNLRHKLGAGYIETVRGVGYRAGKTAR